jgi:hypothetical protein
MIVFDSSETGCGRGVNFCLSEQTIIRFVPINNSTIHYNVCGYKKDEIFLFQDIFILNSGCVIHIIDNTSSRIVSLVLWCDGSAEVEIININRGSNHYILEEDES